MGLITETDCGRAPDIEFADMAAPDDRDRRAASEEQR
jgi:hypothetical protein